LAECGSQYNAFFAITCGVTSLFTFNGIRHGVEYPIDLKAEISGGRLGLYAKMYSRLRSLRSTQN
jgi:hypothetical protein